MPRTTAEPLTLDKLHGELVRSMVTRTACVITLHEMEAIGPGKHENTYTLLNIVNGWIHVVREDADGAFLHECIAVSDVYDPIKSKLGTHRWITLG